ncbi:levanbiose-producing levanase [Spiroplasma litorale]|uniref:Levanbiose-producing levanase n=1 Tax=Spiroplasma litorale TaxID=216942 RepID=A0A0K1W1V4_9MOLU|nr:glycoside hydrolase family 32 protein [Spiroplasma litorale]AKX34289.1 levanbiose-producing levanase [Spiroplasma litorale]
MKNIIKILTSLILIICGSGLISFIYNFKNSSEVYVDKYKNKFHLQMPDFGMMNDIQGAFFREGKWHLYFLYNKDAKLMSNGINLGGNGTSWYHVTTIDFINWKYEGVAIEKYITEWGDVATGSIYEDFDNDFGFGSNAIIAYATAYSDKGQNTMVYYSIDNGYKFNPIVDYPIQLNNGKKDFRDPQILKMKDDYIIYLAENDRFGIYASKNPLGNFENIGYLKMPYPTLECPNLFKINVTNSASDEKWVLIYGGNEGDDRLTTGTYYSVGHIENKIFIPEQNPKRVDFGPDFYGAATWKNNKNSLFISGWMSNWNYATSVPNQGKVGNMSLVRKLNLFKKYNEYTLESMFYIPEKYYKKINKGKLNSNNDKLEITNIEGDSFNLKINIELLNNIENTVEISIIGNEYSFNLLIDIFNSVIIITRFNSIFTNNETFSKKREVYLDEVIKNNIDIEFIIDRTTIEVILPSNKVYSSIKFPKYTSSEKILIKTKNELILNYEYKYIDII